MKLVYDGSVKKVYDNGADTVFEFSDQYSVFDWGVMPDVIPNKGSSLAIVGANLFEYLGTPESWQNWKGPGSELYKRFSQKGIDHHYLSRFDEKFMKVKKINIIHPVPIYAEGQMFLDYGPYEQKPIDTLVPLEVIFRFGMTEGSSIFKRVGDSDYMKELGLDSGIEMGTVVEHPIIEFSTKLEKSDRYIRYAEAREIAGLDNSEFLELKEYATLLALRLKDHFAEQEIELIDGKFEFAFIKGKESRTFMLVDSIGPDELRMSYKGKQLSKECLRTHYRDSQWAIDVEVAKTDAKVQAVYDWKTLCKSNPIPCDAKLLKDVSSIYMAVANRLTGVEHFKGVSL